MMQSLTDAHNTDDQVTREPQADPAAVEAVLAASQPVVALTMKSLSAAADEATVAQYRVLWVLVSRSRWRLVDLAAALGVTQSSAGRMCGRLARRGLVRRHRADGDRRTVLVSVTAAGRQAVGAAAGRHRALVADILGRLPGPAQRAVADAFRDFADAAGEVRESRRPGSAPAGASVPRQRPPAGHGRRAPQVSSIRTRAKERS
jgi:DNA-binding MarR family transcriptional regulator